MLKNILKNLSLTPEETQAYLTLLKTGLVPAGKLAKEMNLPRSTVYGYLESLKKQGLVVESLDGKLKLFEAENPENITLLLEKQREQIDKDINLYKTILPKLKKNIVTNTQPRFKFYDGVKGAKFVINDVLNYHNTEVKSMWPIKNMIQIIGAEFLSRFNIRRIESKIHLKLIWPKNDKIDIKKYPFLGIGNKFLRDIKIAPDELNYSLGYWLYDNKVAFLSSTKEAFGIIIESPELKKSLESQFDLIWKTSKNYKTILPKECHIWLRHLRLNTSRENLSILAINF